METVDTELTEKSSEVSTEELKETVSRKEILDLYVKKLNQLPLA